MARRRPLRSLLIGDVDHYPSEFALGVAQAMTLLGHWHSAVSIRQPIAVITKRIVEVQPDLVFAHMLLWSPAGDAHRAELLALLADWRGRGTRVVLHDGDARAETRYPHDISAAVDLALCNHTADRSAWGIPQLRWPYGAFVQRRPAAPVEEFRCALAFAGRLGSGLYAARTALVLALQARLGGTMLLLVPNQTARHTLFRTPELAASADAVLGYGRPELSGWCDVRTFQYPGAGGVLLSDDVQGFLEPGVHYLPYAMGQIASVLEAVGRAHADGARIRQAAFRYVQAKHTWLNRVGEVLRRFSWSGRAR